jgi:hypothetical protein
MAARSLTLLYSIKGGALLLAAAMLHTNPREVKEVMKITAINDSHLVGKVYMTSVKSMVVLFWRVSSAIRESQ